MTHFESASGLDAATKLRIEKDFEELRSEFSIILDPDTVERCLDRSMSAFAGASVPNFVPFFAHRFARQQLVAVSQNRGLMDKALPEVLFVDIRDSGRSQIAAALLAAKAPGLAHVRTAGTDPDDQLNDTVAAVLQDRGIDLSGAYAKPLTDAVTRAADVIVTLGCANAVPWYPHQQRYDWDIPDVTGLDRAKVTAVCADIDRRVEELVDRLRATPPHG